MTRCTNQYQILFTTKNDRSHLFRFFLPLGHKEEYGSKWAARTRREISKCLLYATYVKERRQIPWPWIGRPKWPHLTVERENLLHGCYKTGIDAHLLIRTIFETSSGNSWPPPCTCLACTDHQKNCSCRKTHIPAAVKASSGQGFPDKPINVHNLDAVTCIWYSIYILHASMIWSHAKVINVISLGNVEHVAGLPHLL